MAFLSLLLFEVVYRYQWIDFYATEYHFLNPQLDLEDERPRVLVMGDSFTASDSNYVDQLRGQFPGLQFINSAVPGTGAVQASYMAPRRFRAVEPDLVVYQVYLGNDLFDIRNPTSFRRMSLVRNLYWATANRFRSIGYLNYKMGQFFAAPPDTAKMMHFGFSPERYNAREKMYLKAAPNWLTEQLKLGAEWESGGESYLAYVADILERANEDAVP